MKMLIATVFVAVGLASPGRAETMVSGVVGTTTWTKANSPYVVDNMDIVHTTDGVTISAGATLTIEAGVEVMFGHRAGMSVRGRLVVSGTNDERVRLHPKPTSQGTPWAGITMAGSGISTLHYADIDGARLEYADLNGGVSGSDILGGGGLRISGGHHVTLVGCRLTNNTSNTGSAGGGGAYVSGANSSATFDRCEFIDNVASYVSDHSGEVTTQGIGGGIRVANGGHATMVGCVFGGNLAGNNGSAVAARGAEATLIRCTISGNRIKGSTNLGTEHTGGAIDAYAGTVALENCTFWRNTSSYGVASGSGGWAGVYASSSSTIAISNTVIWPGPGQVGGVPVSGDNGSAQASYSNLFEAIPGTGNISADPLFVDPAAGDFSLQQGSPCIDAGDPASPIDSDSSWADIGAYESPYGWRVAVGPAARPALWTLEPARPNPFNPSTTIHFTVAENGRVKLSVYDVNGRHVRDLADRTFGAGSHSLRWDGTDGGGRPAASGVYALRLRSEGHTLSRRVTLLR